MKPTPSGGSHTVDAHRLFSQQGIKHHYDNSLVVPHRWDAAWMEPTLSALMALTERNGARQREPAAPGDSLLEIAPDSQVCPTGNAKYEIH
jgi:hypothetical protein